MGYFPNLRGVAPNTTLAKLVSFLGADPARAIRQIFQQQAQPGDQWAADQAGRLNPMPYPFVNKMVSPIGYVIDAQNRFGPRAGTGTEGEGRAYPGGANPPGAVTPGTGSTNPGTGYQTSFGEPDIGLRNMLETQRYGRVLTDLERSQLSQPQFAPGQVVPFPPPK